MWASNTQMPLLTSIPCGRQAWSKVFHFAPVQPVSRLQNARDKNNTGKPFPFDCLNFPKCQIKNNNAPDPTWRANLCSIQCILISLNGPDFPFPLSSSRIAPNLNKVRARHSKLLRMKHRLFYYYYYESTINLLVALPSFLGYSEAFSY